ncbi:hypothetical protein [Saliphagus sp. LR7]|uniref:DUF7547 family protein n=1 Tax=Saliphagus sp. LR7 TaxID=2282654 RepID=UPI000DF7F933|nr:hypothetical protein [Saliphagus sp. LR7]
MAERNDAADAIGDLVDTLEELRGELEPDSPGPGRGPPLRPPTPGELLRMADEVAIPLLIRTLEAQIRALERLQRAVGLLRREREVRERTGETRERSRERVEGLRDRTLDGLDDVLAELGRTVEGEPTDRRARELLADARELRDEIDDRLRDATEGRERRGRDSDRVRDARTIEVTSPDEEDEDEETDVDVDAELDTLRDRYRPEEGGEEADGLDGGDESVDTDGEDDEGDDTEESGEGDGADGDDDRPPGAR